jgi:hypothetical protein
MAILSRRSVVNIDTGFTLDDRRVGVLVPVGSRIITSQYYPDQHWGPHSLVTNGYGGSFHGGEVAGV